MEINYFKKHATDRGAYLVLKEENKIYVHIKENRTINGIKTPASLLELKEYVIHEISPTGKKILVNNIEVIV